MPETNSLDGTQTPTAVETSAVAATRFELGILHDLFATVGNGTIRARDWERAKSVLDYLEAKINPLEAMVQTAQAPLKEPK